MKYHLQDDYSIQFNNPATYDPSILGTFCVELLVFSQSGGAISPLIWILYVDES